MSRRQKNVTELTNYQSYLLRMWHTDGQEQSWRASLQNAFNDERICFANLDDLIGYLRQLTVVNGDDGVEDSDACA